MKIELAHDFIAKKIYEEASIEDKARSKAIMYLQERHAFYHSSPQELFLTQNDINYINPYLGDMDLSKEEKNYVKSSKSIIKRRKKITKIKNYTIIVLVCSSLFSLWGFWERDKFNEAKSQLVYAENKIEKLMDNMRSDKSKNILPVAVTFSPIKITGNIKNEKGNALANCTISVLGATTNTKEDGYFELQLILSPTDMPVDTKIEFSHNGYLPISYSLDTDLEELNFNVILER